MGKATSIHNNQNVSLDEKYAHLEPNKNKSVNYSLGGMENAGV